MLRKFGTGDGQILREPEEPQEESHDEEETEEDK